MSGRVDDLFCFLHRNKKKTPRLPLFAMSTLNGASVVPEYANGTVEGLNGDKRPRTPTGTMALTEYSANPSPPSEERRAKSLVPEELLLPNGYPDVSFSRKSAGMRLAEKIKKENVMANNGCLVPTNDCRRDIPSLRGL